MLKLGRYSHKRIQSSHLKVIALCEHWFNTTLVEPTGKELRMPRVLVFPKTKSARETPLLEEKYN